ncbi:MAG: TlpA disulfide reductase family protein [Actinomycetota bacterium]
MVKTATKLTRQERLAQARAARRRKERAWRFGVPAVAIAALVGAAIVLTSGGGGGGGTGTGPSNTDSITVEGQPLTGQPGQTVPAFSAPALGGGTVSWSDDERTPRVLAIWAPWCPHCQVEMPIIAKVAAEFPDVPVVTVATSIGEAPGPTPEAFMEERKLTWPAAVDDEAHTIADALGVKGFPTTYFVAADGTVENAFSGETTEADLRAAFEELTAGATNQD